jgi:hypothetical protein
MSAVTGRAVIVGAEGQNGGDDTEDTEVGRMCRYSRGASWE